VTFPTSPAEVPDAVRGVWSGGRTRAHRLPPSALGGV